MKSKTTKDSMLDLITQLKAYELDSINLIHYQVLIHQKLLELELWINEYFRHENP